MEKDKRCDLTVTVFSSTSTAGALELLDGLTLAKTEGRRLLILLD
jgi:hypothetical protein